MLQWLIHKIAEKQSVTHRGYPNMWADFVKTWNHRNTEFYRMKVGGWIHKAMTNAGVSGITLGYVVIIRNDRWHKVTACDGGKEHSTLVKHEMVHHGQCERSGSLLWQSFKYGVEYLFIYLTEWDRHAYYDNSYEIEARTMAGQSPLIDWRARGCNRWTPWKLKGK